MNFNSQRYSVRYSPIKLDGGMVLDTHYIEYHSFKVWFLVLCQDIKYI